MHDAQRGLLGGGGSERSFELLFVGVRSRQRQDLVPVARVRQQIGKWRNGFSVVGNQKPGAPLGRLELRRRSGRLLPADLVPGVRYRLRARCLVVLGGKCFNMPDGLLVTGWGTDERGEFFDPPLLEKPNRLGAHGIGGAADWARREPERPMLEWVGGQIDLAACIRPAAAAKSGRWPADVGLGERPR